MKHSFIEAGEIVTTHGVRGEVKVLCWLDSPHDLTAYRRCRIGGKEYRVDSCRVQKSCCLVKLHSVDTMEAGQALREKTLEIFREDAPAGKIFADELKGMDVYNGGTLMGQVTDVLDYPGNSVYVVTGQREYMIPAVKEFVLNLNLDENRMDVKLLEGMASDED